MFKFFYIIIAILAILTTYAQLSDRGIFASRLVKISLLITGTGFMIFSVIYLWRTMSFAIAAGAFLIFMIIVFIMPAFTHPHGRPRGMDKEQKK